MFASLLVGLAVTVGAQDKKDPPAKDPPAKDAPIVGEWVGEKAVAGGMERPVPAGGITFKFGADGSLSVTEGKRE